MRLNNYSKIIVLTATFTILQGCLSTTDEMVAEGYPLAYAEGFDDGCHSGNKAGGRLFEEFKKDVDRFNSDAQYAQGWSDAFRQCESEEEALQRKTRMAIEQQNLMEQRKANDRNEKYDLEKHLLDGMDTSGLENLGK